MSKRFYVVYSVMEQPMQKIFKSKASVNRHLQHNPNLLSRQFKTIEEAEKFAKELQLTIANSPSNYQMNRDLDLATLQKSSLDSFKSEQLMRQALIEKELNIITGEKEKKELADSQNLFPTVPENQMRDPLNPQGFQSDQKDMQKASRKESGNEKAKEIRNDQIKDSEDQANHHMKRLNEKSRIDEQKRDLNSKVTDQRDQELRRERLDKKTSKIVENAEPKKRSKEEVKESILLDVRRVIPTYTAFPMKADWKSHNSIRMSSQIMMRQTPGYATVSYRYFSQKIQTKALFVRKVVPLGIRSVRQAQLCALIWSLSDLLISEALLENLKCSCTISSKPEDQLRANLLFGGLDFQLRNLIWPVEAREDKSLSEKTAVIDQLREYILI